MAAAKRSTSCWVSEVEPLRSSSDKSTLYDFESTIVRPTLSLIGHTRNGCTTQEVTEMLNVTVRRSTSGDESALARLAALDSASPPRGPALVAEADTRILAALPLGSGRPIADPFEPTLELIQLLELRRSQIERVDGEPARRGFRSLLRGRLSHA